MKKLLKNNIFQAFLAFLIFLIIGAITIKDYGINWDEPFHFFRGQAYLHYFLTGKTNYSDLPAYPKITGSIQESFEEAVRSKQDVSGQIRRSYFATDIYDFEGFIKNDEGHPPITDILAAFSNYIFYQKLGIIGDLDSYHFYEIFISAILVGALFYFVKREFGFFPALVSAFALGSYPLFFSESHFNIKDPPLAVFYGLTIILFYLGITKENWRLILVSAVVCGLGLGTKFNIVFLPFVLGPWLLYYLIIEKKFRKINFKKVLPIIISLIIFLPITFGVFYLLWPFLWANPVDNFLKIVDFYKQIGTNTPGEMSHYLFLKWNTYPFYWIIVTTPLTILFLSFLGFIVSIYLFLFKRKGIALLACLWFIFPIFRVSVPNTGLYGGVRQIMEFLPGMALLAGIGVNFLLAPRRFRIFIIILIIIGLIFTIYEMVRIHPNENVYFNQLIGGLPGARARNIPYWGDTYGNVYEQGVKWLNKNAEPNAKLGLPIGTVGNIPRIKLRSDFNLSNAYWSGTNREGEYEIEMDYEWPIKYSYSFQYYDRYLNPVYVAAVDGISLLKIWKNDLEHTKPEFRQEIVYFPKAIKFRQNSQNQELWIDLGKEIYLTRITIKHSDLICQELTSGYLALSSNNKTWQREYDPINTPQVPVTATGWSKNNFVFLFAGKKARYLILDPQMDGTCLFKNPQIEIKGLEVLP